MIKNPLVIHTAMMEALESEKVEFPFSLADVEGVMKDSKGKYSFHLIDGTVFNSNGEKEFSLQVSP